MARRQAVVRKSRYLDPAEVAQLDQSDRITDVMGQDDGIPDFLKRSENETTALMAENLLFKEEVIQPSFAKTCILLTTSSSGVHRWSNTELQGTLQITKINYTDLGRYADEVPPIIRFKILNDKS